MLDKKREISELKAISDILDFALEKVREVYPNDNPPGGIISEKTESDQTWLLMRFSAAIMAILKGTHQLTENRLQIWVKQVNFLSPVIHKIVRDLLERN